MRFLGRYRFLVTGDARRAMPGSDSKIGYLFGRLLPGEESAMSGLSNLGIKVQQLDDRDEIITVPGPDATDG